MDVPREPKGPGRRIALVLTLLLLLVAVTIVLGRIEPALPVVDSDLVVMASVERGMLPLEIRGWGELKSDQYHSVESSVGGRVTKIRVEPGDVVKAGAPLVELSSPDLALEAAKAEQEFTAARAAFTALRRSIGTQRYEREASLVNLRSELTRAGRSVERLESLFARGEVSEAELTAATDEVHAIEQTAPRRRGDAGPVERDGRRAGSAGEESAGFAGGSPASGAGATFGAARRGFGRRARRRGSRRPSEIGSRPEPSSSASSAPNACGLNSRCRSPGRLEFAPGTSCCSWTRWVTRRTARCESSGRALPVKGDQYARVSVQLLKPPRADAAFDAGVDAIINIGQLDNALFVKRPAWAADDGVASVFRVDPEARRRSE